MEPDFWHRRWQKNEIGFHESEGSHLLKQYFKAWNLPENARVFVPLCGKTRDIAWFLSHGIDVVAIELNESAVTALFAELGVAPKIENSGKLLKYSAEGLVVYVGDFFSLSAADIGHIDGVYDRASLVALPATLRDKYSDYLRQITSPTPQLLITFDYDQALFAGPPFSVTDDIVDSLYNDHYVTTCLHRGKIAGGFREQIEVYEAVYILNARSA